MDWGTFFGCLLFAVIFSGIAFLSFSEANSAMKIPANEYQNYGCAMFLVGLFCTLMMGILLFVVWGDLQVGWGHLMAYIHASR